MADTNDERADIVFGTIFLVLALFTLVITSQIQGPQRTDASIRTFPTFVGIGMTILSLVLILRGLRTRKKAGQAPTAADVPAQASSNRSFTFRFLSLVVLGFLYTQIVRPAGYLVATPVLVFGAMLVYGEKKWYRLILVPLVVTLVLYHVFRTFFRVPLPRFGLW